QGPSLEHEGFIITATPESRGGQYLTVGEIRSKDEEDERVHRFIRADMNPSFEQACEHTLLKGKQIINERGAQVLDS
ncbi:MAG: HlyU family transcriptional regulator, partial [Granulosicoccaceae bacterium]